MKKRDKAGFVKQFISDNPGIINEENGLAKIDMIYNSLEIDANSRPSDTSGQMYLLATSIENGFEFTRQELERHQWMDRIAMKEKTKEEAINKILNENPELNKLDPDIKGRLSKAFDEKLENQPFNVQVIQQAAVDLTKEVHKIVDEKEVELTKATEQEVTIKKQEEEKKNVAQENEKKEEEQRARIEQERIDKEEAERKRLEAERAQKEIEVKHKAVEENIRFEHFKKELIEENPALAVKIREDFVAERVWSEIKDKGVDGFVTEIDGVLLKAEKAYLSAHSLEIVDGVLVNEPNKQKEQENAPVAINANTLGQGQTQAPKKTILDTLGKYSIGQSGDCLFTLQGPGLDEMIKDWMKDLANKKSELKLAKAAMASTVAMSESSIFQRTDGAAFSSEINKETKAHVMDFAKHTTEKFKKGEGVSYDDFQKFMKERGVDVSLYEGAKNKEFNASFDRNDEKLILNGKAFDVRSRLERQIDKDFGRNGMKRDNISVIMQKIVNNAIERDKKDNKENKLRRYPTEQQIRNAVDAMIDKRLIPNFKNGEPVDTRLVLDELKKRSIQIDEKYLSPDAFIKMGKNGEFNVYSSSNHKMKPITVNLDTKMTMGNEYDLERYKTPKERTLQTAMGNFNHLGLTEEEIVEESRKAPALGNNDRHNPLLIDPNEPGYSGKIAQLFQSVNDNDFNGDADQKKRKSMGM